MHTCDIQSVYITCILYIQGPPTFLFAHLLVMGEGMDSSCRSWSSCRTHHPWMLVFGRGMLWRCRASVPASWLCFVSTGLATSRAPGQAPHQACLCKFLTFLMSLKLLRSLTLVRSLRKPGVGSHYLAHVDVCQFLSRHAQTWSAKLTLLRSLPLPACPMMPNWHSLVPRRRLPIDMLVGANYLESH